MEPSIQVMYYKGWFDLEKPTSEMIDIRDVALGLSRQARYQGFTTGFYSVAEHSTLLAGWMLKETNNPEVAVLGLLHDAAEAYIGDMVSPLKQFIPEFKIWEDRLMIAIREKLMPEKSKWYGHSSYDERVLLLKQADQRIRIDETNKLFSGGAKDNWAINNAQELTYSREPLKVKIEPLDPGLAEQKYLNAYHMYLSELTHGIPTPGRFSG